MVEKRTEQKQKASLQNAFNRGVQETADMPAFVTDFPRRPTKEFIQNFMNNHNATFSSQTPLDIENPEHVAMITKISKELSKHGPSSLSIEGGCVANLSSTFFSSKEKLAVIMSDVEKTYLLPIPSKLEIYAYLTGRHEGTHCDPNRDNKLPPLAELTLEELNRRINEEGTPAHIILGREVKSDFAVKTTNTTDPAVLAAINTFLNWRALSIFFRPELNAGHGTTAFLSNLRLLKNGTTEQHIETLKTGQQSIFERTAKTIGLEDADTAQELFEENPELFIDVLESMVKQGQFDDSPILKEIASNFAWAMRESFDMEAYGFGYTDIDMEEEEIAVTYLSQVNPARFSIIPETEDEDAQYNVTRKPSYKDSGQFIPEALPEGTGQVNTEYKDTNQPLPGRKP